MLAANADPVIEAATLAVSKYTNVTFFIIFYYLHLIRSRVMENVFPLV